MNDWTKIKPLATDLNTSFELANPYAAQPVIFQNQGINPDTRARSLQLQPDLQLPVELIEEELPRYEAEARFKRFDLGQYADLPVTYAGLANPQESPLYVDDVENLSAWEKFFGGVAKSWRAGRRNVSLKEINQRKFWGTATEDDLSLEKALDIEARGYKPGGNFENYFAQIPSAVAEMAPLYLAALSEAWDEALIGGALGSVIPGVGTAAGLATGVGYGTVIEMGKMEAYLAYKELSELTDSTGRKIDNDAARGAATMVGILNGSLELLGAKAAYKITGLDKIAGKISRSRIKDLMKIPANVDTFAKVGRVLGGGMLTEGTIEALQEAVNLFVGEPMAVALDGGEAPIELTGQAQATEEVGQAFRMGSQVGLAFGGPKASLGALIDYSEQKRLNRNAEISQELAGMIEGSKTFQRMPDKFRQHIQQIKAEYGVATDVTVPFDILTQYFQEAGITVEQIEAEMPAVAKSFRESSKTRSDVAIPVEDYAAYFARSKNFTAYLQDVRMHPELPTDREAAEMRQQIKEMIDSTPIKDQALYEQVRDKLAEVESPDVADFQARLLSSFFETQAATMGVPAADLWAQYRVDIEREDFAGLQTEELIADLQQGKIPGDEEIYGPSLQTFVQQYGRDDMVVEEAVKRGYFDTEDPMQVTPADFEKALSEGQPRYAYGRENIGLLQRKEKLTALQQQAEKLGIDITAGTPAEIAAQMKGMEQTAAQVAEFRKANNLPELKLRKDGSHPTQIATTKSTYRKIADNLMPPGIKGGKILDYGAGKNIGGKELGADTFEPHPEEGFVPTYEDSAAIPSDSYDGVISNAVLNVVPDDVRDSIVREIGRVLKPGGQAFINVRGKDVFSNKHTVVNADSMEVIVDSSGAYQKGFTQDELIGYLQKVLGPGFTVEKPAQPFGTVSAVVTKIDTVEQAAELIAAAINGPAIDAQVAPPPYMDTYYQVQNLPEWKEKTEVWMRKNGYSPDEIKAHLAAIEGQMKIFAALGPVQLEMLPQGHGLNKRKGPIRKNDDPIYQITFDASAMCVKRLEAAATATAVQAKIGRALTTSERMALVALFRMAGKAAPCIYCYVEAPRSKSSEFVKIATDVVMGAKPKESWGDTIKTLAADAQAEAKKLGFKTEDIDVNVILDPALAVTKEAKATIDSAPAIYKFLKKVMLAAKANLPKLYEEYSGQILDLPAKQIEELNGYAVMRFFSSSDFQAEHVADLMQAIFDLQVRKAKAHVYTKVPAFVEIFGNTKMKVQTSIFAQEVDGKIVEDSWQGMEWEKAKKFRAEHDHVGTILVASSDEIVAWALEQDWIDYIIPFHYSGLESKFYGALDWQDFTSTQSEQSLVKGAKATKIRQHETGSVAGISNEAGTRRYLELALERKLIPVFPAFMFKDGLDPVYAKNGKTLIKDQRGAKNKRAVARWREMVEAGQIDWDAINPNYYKLRKDYARTDTPFEPVQADINLEAADQILQSFMAGDQPSAQVDQGIVDQLLEMIDEADGTGRDIGVESLQKAREIRRLNQGEETPRGFIQMNRARDYFKITLAGQADLSTFLHESGHMFLEIMQSLASRPDAAERITTDMQVIRDWLGVQPGEAFTREQHEKFARGFEAYLMEGKAPSEELRSSFQRFKAWLTSIYHELMALNVELTDEVRDVMARMLATEEAINRTAELQRLTPLFMDMESSGLTEAEHLDYLHDYARGLEEAEETMFKRLMGEIQSHKKSQYRKAAKQIQAEVRAEVAARPVYQARNFLKTGKLSDGTTPAGGVLGKLDRAILERMFPGAKFSGNLAGITIKDGADPTIVAKYFGFKNADELLTALREAPGIAEVIKTEVKKRLDAIFGDSFNPEDMAKEARQALHNDRVSSMLTRELRVLGFKANRPVPAGFNNYARIMAEEQIGRTKIGLLQAHRFMMAEQRYGKQAFDAAGRNDWLVAAEAKRLQILNHWLYRKAVAAQEDVDTIRNFLGKFQQTEKRKKLGLAGGHYLESIDALLSGADLSHASMKRIAKRKSLESYLRQMEADGQIVQIPQELRDEVALKNYKEMTMEEFRTLRDAVTNIDHLARLKNKLLLAKDKREFGATMAAVVSNIHANAKKIIQLKKNRPTDWEKLQARMRGMDADLLKVEFLVEQLDGDVAGLLHSLIFEPMAKAQATKYDMLKAINKSLYEPLRKMPKAQKARMAAEYNFHGTSMKGHEVLAVALNMGNEGNRKKLIGGYPERGYTEDSLMQELDRILTREDWQLVQHIWDQVNQFWPEIAALNKKYTGLEPPKVQPLQVDSKHGTFAGGYYPVIYDPHRHHRAMVNAQKGNDLFENNFLRPGVSSGFTEARTKYVAPMLLSLDALPNHLNEVIHYLTHYEAVTQANRIIEYTDFRQAVTDTVGAEYYQGLRPWLQAIANDGRSDIATTYIEGFARHATVGLSIMTMGFSTSTMLVQVLGLSSTLSRLGPKWTMSGIKGAFSLDQRKLAYEQSNELRHTMQTFDREARSAYNEMLAMISGKLSDKIRYRHAQVVNFAFYTMGLLQQQVNYASWIGAYNMACAEGRSDAVAVADAAMRKSQSAAGIKDLAKVQRQSDLRRMFTAFYTYFSALYGQLRAAGQRMTSDPLIASAQLATLVLLPVLVEQLMRDGLPDDDDPADEWLKAYASGVASFGLASLPLLRDFVQPLITDYDYAISPAGQTFSRMMVAAARLAEGEALTPSQVTALVKGLGTLAHLPANQVIRSYRYFDKLFDGEIEEPIREFIFGVNYDRN